MFAEVFPILQIISKDTNVMIVALAGQCVAGLAKGLKKKFAPFSLSFTEVILEKFKEKKTNVVTAMRDAIDAVYQTVRGYIFLPFCSKYFQLFLNVLQLL